MNSGAASGADGAPGRLAARLICAGEQADGAGAFVGERALGRLAAWLPEWTISTTNRASPRTPPPPFPKSWHENVSWRLCPVPAVGSGDPAQGLCWENADG
jgi:hypothetical protein